MDPETVPVNTGRYMRTARRASQTAEFLNGVQAAVAEYSSLRAKPIEPVPSLRPTLSQVDPKAA